MSTTLFIVFLFAIFVACYFLARKDDKILDLQQRVSYLEQKVNKKLVSRLLFVELKSVNSVLDTLNNCFYEIDENGDYDVDRKSTRLNSSHTVISYAVFCLKKKIKKKK